MVVEYYHKCVCGDWKLKKKRFFFSNLGIFISDLGKTPHFCFGNRGRYSAPKSAHKIPEYSAGKFCVCTSILLASTNHGPIFFLFKRLGFLKMSFPLGIVLRLCRIHDELLSVVLNHFHASFGFTSLFQCNHFNLAFLSNPACIVLLLLNSPHPSFICWMPSFENRDSDLGVADKVIMSEAGACLNRMT